MSFQPLHRDKEHKFKNGFWTWGENDVKLKFHSHVADDKKTKSHFHPVDAGLEFRKFIDVAEEKIFREIFVRPNSFYDSEVVTIQDIKNLVLFSIESGTTQKFIDFVHRDSYDEFLHAIIFYMELYLMVLELLLIRRDKEAAGIIRDTYSIKVEQFLSKQLSDRRLLIAKAYSKVFMRLIHVLIRSFHVFFYSGHFDVQQKRSRIKKSDCEAFDSKRFAFFRVVD